MDFNTLPSLSIGNVPLDRGNLFAVQMKLRALEGYDYQMYLLYLAELKYFSNLWNVEGDKDLRYMFPMLMRVATENGKVAIAKDSKGKPAIYALVDYKEDFKGHIVKGKGLPYTFRMIKENAGKSRDLNESNAIFLKLSSTGYPLLFFMWNFIEKLNHYLVSADTNTKTKTKKFKWNINNNSSVIQEAEQRAMTDPTTPWVVNITSPVGYGVDNETKKVQNNVLEPIMKNASSEDSIWSDIGEFEKFWYKRLGKRMNVNMKKERNISDEYDFESANFDTMENETKIYLEKFIEDYNAMFGTNAKVISNMSKLDKEGGSDNADTDKDGE